MSTMSEHSFLSAEFPQVKAFAPGRTEIAGNHVDHQGGCVLSGTVSRGITATAAENGTDLVRILSMGYEPFALDVADTAPRPEERNTTTSLVRGMIACFMEAGVPIRGFDMRVTSTLPTGGGLSSSAAFELLLAQSLNCLFGYDAFEPATLAQWGWRVESEWFGKPCGLQDQTIVAAGGIQLMDFADPARVRVRPVSFDFEEAGYAVVLVDTHCDHSKFAAEFARIPADMARVAHCFGEAVLGAVDEAEFFTYLPRVRKAVGDKALLRALHFFRENESVRDRMRALEAGDMDEFLRLTRESGASSAQFLQNVATDGDFQPAMVALALAERMLEGRGAVRIHGGGFGGSIQAFVPLDRLEPFCRRLDGWLGAGSCLRLSIGGQGAHAQWC